MGDSVKEKIVMSTLKLISEKGYKSTTTKNIAEEAGVNEVTIFRCFGSKKDIVLYALKELELLKPVNEKILDKCIWNLKEDLIMLAHEYHKNFTEEKAKIMMGLRSPEIFEEVKEYLMKIPKGFKEVLIKYFEKMYEKGLLNTDNFELLAFAFMSLNFGFILMNVSYGNKLIGFGDSEFVKKTIEIFVRGVEKSD
ncbi:transcriptional regulator, TetR family [Thermoanaerobacter mathranii subsp. mathranii str. A3]|uniref:Transcriptional regulator, TetR family n=2 Tax=Thermoanaerobacter TaxID=1754 RepID=D3T6I1_THEIA|nr:MULTISPECIES: TetR/AcrR family transcriptional regulator [Thermoanaerobacter]ADD01594.1 transcriptional regulator, TetR family [Thermoanaerobacter italicus Ab9]ADH60130.1 transcriptional regulator, TetR family [Thermoanaerobacter mathranii subsp. mathranii str. A3]SFD97297.1 transcriptional regulator, TetR family [Thermoanaerobacter thermohydrosulfuricus]